MLRPRPLSAATSALTPHTRSFPRIALNTDVQLRRWKVHPARGHAGKPQSLLQTLTPESCRP
eukprot:3132007-Alexandrium_andersonii.AAC.1